VKIDSRRWTLLLAIGLILVALVIFLISALTPPAVTVEWSTASELNTAGFNVARGNSPNGPFTRLNAEVIPASPDPLVGGSYVFTDTNVTPGQTYYYQLEEVEFGGSATPQGTVVVTAPYSITPVALVAGIGLAVILIAALLWIERPRRAGPGRTPPGSSPPSQP
jgi:hypothetical protein